MNPICDLLAGDVPFYGSAPTLRLAMLGEFHRISTQSASAQCKCTRTYSRLGCTTATYDVHIPITDSVWVGRAAGKRASPSTDLL